MIGTITCGELSCETVYAVTWGARLHGLHCYTHGDMEHRQLLLRPCRGVHTYGMKYALDIAFLNRDNEVLRVMRRVRPQRIVWGPLNTHSVIERSACPGAWYKVKDRLEETI
ncbi:MAG: DUF192 domain-containing protein [Coriobacteriia bacterium]|nr:DUF192 domain-containing protein [Coriobacteriia bacterium]